MGRIRHHHLLQSPESLGDYQRTASDFPQCLLSRLVHPPKKDKIHQAEAIVEGNAKNSPRKALSKVVLGLFAFQRSTPLANETPSLIVPLQILRVAAAVTVATAHIPQIDTFLPISRYGAVGVDIFFVISGFIMVQRGICPARWL